MSIYVGDISYPNDGTKNGVCFSGAVTIAYVSGFALILCQSTLVGRYVFLYDNWDVYFGFCEIVVLGYPYFLTGM